VIRLWLFIGRVTGHHLYLFREISGWSVRDIANNDISMFHELFSWNIISLCLISQVGPDGAGPDGAGPAGVGSDGGGAWDVQMGRMRIHGGLDRRQSWHSAPIMDECISDTCDSLQPKVHDTCDSVSSYKWLYFHDTCDSDVLLSCHMWQCSLAFMPHVTVFSPAFMPHVTVCKYAFMTHTLMFNVAYMIQVSLNNYYNILTFIRHVTSDLKTPI